MDKWVKGEWVKGIMQEIRIKKIPSREGWVKLKAKS
jgi:hypothetical protein